MQKLSLGAVIALTLAMLSYAGVVASHGSVPVAPTGVKYSPRDLAARQRMARLVAEVAARSAAQTAKAVALEKLHRQQAPAASAQVAVETTLAANK